MHLKRVVRDILTALALAVLIAGTAGAQSLRRSERRQAVRESLDSRRKEVPQLTEFPDTLIEDGKVAPMDSLALLAAADSLQKADSLALLEKSSLKHPVFTTAGDSIFDDFSGGKRLRYYYGGVTVEYDDMTLSADYMEYDMATGIVYARGTYDSLEGAWRGQPEMKQGSQTYKMEELRYNFNTRKARITNMLTNDEEGMIHGRDIMMMPDRSINMVQGRYTVCDEEEPHYYVRMTNARVVTKPSRKTVFGPAYPVIEGVPLPIGVPFGFIPSKPERATGLLMPTFGEEAARGFYVRDAGMYFVFGDYLDLSLTGDLYSLGSWAIDVNSRYKVNYKFNGSFSLTMSNDQTGEKGTPDFYQTRTFGVRWSHSQDSTAHPGQTFSASVNFSSPSNSRYNSRSVSEALNNQASSSISFSKNWNGRFNLSINALHSQNSRDSSYSFTLPNVTFSMSTIYPFKQKHRVGKEKAYEKISFGYSTSLQNKVAFKASEFGGPDFLDRFQSGMTHNFSIGLPNFTVFKYININPGVSYGQNWFFRKSEYVYNEETGRVEQEKGKQFDAFGITQTYSGSVSLNTRLYGMFNFGKYHRIQAIRHVISPSVSLSISPELGTAANGWRTLTYTDADGNLKDYSYNIWSGQLYSPPGKGRNASMSVSIGNNLEAKVRNFADTTGTGSKKIKLIDQFNLSSSYNFLADSLRMSNVGVTMSTSIFEKVGINANATFDPYAINKQGRRINTFNFVKEGWAHPLRLTNASMSLSYSLSGKGEIKGNDGSGSSSGTGYHKIYYHPLTGEYIPGGWVYYANPSVPWSVNLSYSFNFARSWSFSNDELKKTDRYNQTVNLSGNIKLTPRMSVNATSGFDFMAMKITTSQISATYDLHCFNIAVSWVPTGQWKSYSFRIAANASALADLLRFKKSSSYWDN